MKLIKGATPGDIKLDVQEDDYLSHLFDGDNPDMVEVTLTISRAEYRNPRTGMIERHALEKAELEMQFKKEVRRNMDVGISTRHRLSTEQITALLDILAETEAHPADIMQDVMP